MALRLQLFFFFFLFLITTKHLSARTSLFHGAVFLRVSKDVETLQYTTQLLIGTPQLPTKLLVDLSGQSLWLNCAHWSSSRHFVRHASPSCLMAKSNGQTTTGTTICHVRLENPSTGAANSSDLAQDVVTFHGMGSAATVDRFPFSCTPDFQQKGLVNGAKGLLGFGRSKIAVTSQLVNNFDFPRMFTLCLSSTDGFIISGTGIYKSLSYTPLVSTHSKYYVNVKSIKINGRRLAVHVGSVEISSIIPYTIMKSPIFGIIAKAYITAASSINMTIAPPMAPFGVCFRSEGVVSVSVPEIELVMQSELVK